MARGIVAAATGLLVIICLFAGSGCGDRVKPEDFVGDWREIGQAPPCVMHIEPPRGDMLEVTYRRWYRVPGSFEFADGKLTDVPFSPENAIVITYEARDNTITITTGDGPSYTLSRLEAQP